MGGIDVTAVVLGVLGILGVVTQRIERRDHRKEITADIELADKLPQGAARGALEAYIDRRVLRLAAADQQRRDPTGIALGVFLLVAGSYLTLELAGRGGYWLLFALLGVPLVILGLVGFITDVRKAPRDEKGKIIKGR